MQHVYRTLPALNVRVGLWFSLKAKKDVVFSIKPEHKLCPTLCCLPKSEAGMHYLRGGWSRGRQSNGIQGVELPTLGLQTLWCHKQLS